MADEIFVYGGWFPAAVTLPGGETYYKTRVYAGTNGLSVFLRRPGDLDSDTPDWQSPIILADTARPDFARPGETTSA